MKQFVPGRDLSEEDLRELPSLLDERLAISEGEDRRGGREVP